jgi:hypothetical protein
MRRSVWWPLAAGVLTGILLRFVFSGKGGDVYAAMMASFICLAPLAVGAVTVYVAERQARRSWAYYFWAPFFANVLFVCGTLVIMIEGLICAVLIVPVFAVFGSIGGLIMGAVCRATKWPKHMVMSLAVLPLVLAPLEAQLPTPRRIEVVERTLQVNAKPEQIWSRIVDTGAIRPEELAHGWIFRIGVPLPLAGATRQTHEGRIRRVTMGKDIYFDELITDWDQPRYLRWVYRYYEDSFPPHALDDHVKIGGHYFDLLETTYVLAPAGAGTELKVRIAYRVSTQFNWYAVPLARALLGNMAEVNLEYYAKRASRSEPER